MRKLAEKTTILFEVTQEDIDGGQPNSSTSCPLVTAIARALGDGQDYSCSVLRHDDPQSGSWWTCHFRSRGRRASFELPREASHKAAAYDWSGKMEPFSFAAEVDVS